MHCHGRRGDGQKGVGGDWMMLPWGKVSIMLIWKIKATDAIAHTKMKGGLTIGEEFTEGEGGGL